MSVEYSIGIDIGTTSVKVVLVSWNPSTLSHSVIDSISEPTRATVAHLPAGRDEQDVTVIVKTIGKCFEMLISKNCNNFSSLLIKVNRIAISGQMHGVLLWNKTNGQSGIDQLSDMKYSHLITWQDQRCGESFLHQFPRMSNGKPLSSGYGVASILWLMNNEPELLRNFNRSGSIMDFFATLLSSDDDLPMSDHIACSWGYYDIATGDWDHCRLDACHFPKEYLPSVVAAGTVVGQLRHDYFGMKAGVSIYVPVGDLQAYYATDRTRDAVLNISTSAQLCIRTDRAPPTLPVSIDAVPFLDGSVLLLAASLNGGNCLKLFVDNVRQWFTELGCEPPDDASVWTMLIEKALASDLASSPSIRIEPRFLGERHDPQSTGTITGIGSSAISLSSIFSTLCDGLVDNLFGLMDATALSQCKRLFACGNAVDRNPLLRRRISSLFSGEVVFDAQGDSALGAALIALQSVS